MVRRFSARKAVRKGQSEHTLNNDKGLLIFQLARLSGMPLQAGRAKRRATCHAEVQVQVRRILDVRSLDLISSPTKKAPDPVW